MNIVPHLRRLAKWLATPRPYPSWEAACAAAGKYEDDPINKFRVDRHNMRMPDGSLLRSNILSLIAPMLPQNASIVDLGGATGDLGVELLMAHPGMTYTVVENDTLVKLMAEKLGPVDFVTEMPDACDVFYSSGTLQYLERPMDVLQSGFDSARLMVVLVRNSLADNETFHVQSSWLFDNGTGPVPPNYVNRKISYPHRSLRMQDVLDLAAARGFLCRTSLEESSGALYGSEGKQLVFERLPTT